MEQEALNLLKSMLGEEASFRPGQLEAIKNIVNRKKTLVVQRTGWGKSIVYFIATKLLRMQGAGPTILISPLLSLMRNQIETASRIKVKAESISSANVEDWEAIDAKLQRDEIDVLLVSPERLSNSRFLYTTLPSIKKGIGMFVVDEAHCISDWGHDFRPDYRRIVGILQALSANIPVLATTATANDRVISDVQEQLGEDVIALRGPLTRESLALQVIDVNTQVERLGWLAEHLDSLPGTGIIYCTTVANAEKVSDWLNYRGYKVRAYHSRVEDRVELEEMLLNNEVKALTATVALGMGFDKPDLGFVVHYDYPGSVVAYYQQIGRAGRELDRAYAVVLRSNQSERIQNHFIDAAFPTAEQLEKVLETIAATDGLSLYDIMKRANLARSKLDQCLKHLMVAGVVIKQGSKYVRTAKMWQPDLGRVERVTNNRRLELKRMQDLLVTDECLMRFIAEELDDRYAHDCGKCANCRGTNIVPVAVSAKEIAEAENFVKHRPGLIEPRKMWPQRGVRGYRGRINPKLRVEQGRTLCTQGDSGWGKAVQEDKYENNHFREELVEAAVELINGWDNKPAVAWVTAVPSLRRPELVKSFAQRVAAELGIPFHPVLVKTKDTPEQQAMRNSSYQARNVLEAFTVKGKVPTTPVLLIDDIVDSRWTMTVCGMMLKEAGADAVVPFAIASSIGG